MNINYYSYMLIRLRWRHIFFCQLCVPQSKMRRNSLGMRLIALSGRSTRIVRIADKLRFCVSTAYSTTLQSTHYSSLCWHRTYAVGTKLFFATCSSWHVVWVQSQQPSQEAQLSPRDFVSVKSVLNVAEMFVELHLISPASGE